MYTRAISFCPVTFCARFFLVMAMMFIRVSSVLWNLVHARRGHRIHNSGKCMSPCVDIISHRFFKHLRFWRCTSHTHIHTHIHTLIEVLLVKLYGATCAKFTASSHWHRDNHYITWSRYPFQSTLPPYSPRATTSLLQHSSLPKSIIFYLPLPIYQSTKSPICLSPYLALCIQPLKVR